MSVEAWVSLGIMALFNVLSTAFYIGVNKQMLSEVMRRVSLVEDGKAEKAILTLQIERMDERHESVERDLSGIRRDVALLLQRGPRHVE